jgi:hypothetical protein
MNFIIDERARNYIGKATEDKIYSDLINTEEAITMGMERKHSKWNFFWN